MKHNIIAAIILAIGLVAAAFVFSGRYYIITVDQGVALRVDRWTGKVKSYDCSEPWFCDDTPTFAGNETMIVNETASDKDSN